MPKSTATAAMQNVTLSGNERWQPKGPAFVTADGVPTNADDMVFMGANEVLDFFNGDTVYFMAAGGECTIKREPRP